MGVATVAESGPSVGTKLLPKDTEEAEAAIPASEDPAKESASPSDPVMDASLSDSEAESVLAAKLNTDDYYSTMNLKERRKKASKRYLQSQDYSNLMHLRMLDIERRLKAIEGIDSPPK